MGYVRQLARRGRGENRGHVIVETEGVEEDRKERRWGKGVAFGMFACISCFFGASLLFSVTAMRVDTVLLFSCRLLG